MQICNWLIEEISRLYVIYIQVLTLSVLISCTFSDQGLGTISVDNLGLFEVNKQ